MKKILSLVLALLMSASAASFVGAAEEAAIAAEDTAVATTTAVSDAEAEAQAQYADALALLGSWNILHGKGENNLAAADPIKRYEMALFVSRISTGWTDDSKWAVADQWYDRDHDTSGFDDLEGSGAVNVYGALSYASQKGIILGYGNRKFGPEDGITYQDALTMAVRTLGYFNLSWPWGNIEKAVTLGLTKGIPSSIKYTDTLNRGQVAQIIYNALFATTKDGDTLAARNFNGDLDWKSIIITVAGKKGYFLPDADDALNLPGAKLLDGEQKLGFKVVNKDGTLSDTTYWVKTNQIPGLGFADRLENYLGFAYKALFSKDADSNYVTMEWLKPVQDEVVWNEGKLAVKGEFPIYDYLKGLNLRSKFEFAGNTYLNDWNGNYGWKEIIVMNALQGGSDNLKAVGNKYGIDWSASGKGNIVERVSSKDDADYTVKIGDKEAYFKIAWRWNDTINAYFKYVYKDAADGKTELVGIDILDQKDIDDMMADLTYYEKDGTNPRGLFQITEGDYSKWAKTAYASLIPFTLNDAGSPNYGIFEEYRLGQFTEAQIECPKDNNAKKAGFKIYKLNAVSDMAAKLFKEAGVNGGDLNADDFNGLYNQNWGKTVEYSGIYEGSCDHGFYWINDEYGIKPDDGAYVIYSVDKGTGEIKVIKMIYDITNEKHDATNFVATGVVRAYNIEKRTVTIGSTPYDWDYNSLADCGLKLTDASKKELRAEFTYLFKSLFNQYVNYVVCDGKLVYIELAGKSSELIVVDSYAGLSSDGYIVVNGWDTKNLVYRQYKIGSYNGWVKGDYYYYPGQAEVDEAFERGTLYKINSSDISDTDEIYYVSTIALADKYQGWGDGSGMYDLDELVEKGIVDKDEYTVQLEAGYRKIAKTSKIGDTAWEKAKADQKYVLICNPIGNAEGNNWGVDKTNYQWHDLDDQDYPVTYYYGDYAPIIVYKGTGSSSPKLWSATGNLVKDTDATVLVNVPFYSVVGFNKDQYDISYVLFLTYDYEYAAYDGAYSDGWYLLGASEFTAQCFNFYTGKVGPYIAVNKNLKRGYAYPAMNGQIVSDEYVYGAGEVNGAITAAYTSGSHYVYGHDVMKNFNTYVNGDGKTVTGLLWNADQVSLKLLSNHPVIKSSTPDGSGVKGLTNSTAVFLVETEDELDYRPDGKHVKFKNVENISSEEFDEWAKNYDLSELSFWYVHDRLEKRTVFYIEKSGKTVVEAPFEVTTKNLVDVSDTTKNDYAYIEAKLTGTQKQYVVDDTHKYTLDAVIDKIYFDFIGATVENEKEDTHKTLKDDYFYFGEFNSETKEDWETQIEVGGKTYRIHGSIFDLEYDPHVYDDGTCDLIHRVMIDLKSTKANIVDVTAGKIVDSAAIDLVDDNGNLVPATIKVSFTDSNDTKYEFTILVTGDVSTKDGYTVYNFDYKTATNKTQFTADTITGKLNNTNGLIERADAITKNK